MESSSGYKPKRYVKVAIPMGDLFFLPIYNSCTQNFRRLGPARNRIVKGVHLDLGISGTGITTDGTFLGN
jgi:hypothetical protein